MSGRSTVPSSLPPSAREQRRSPSAPAASCSRPVNRPQAQGRTLYELTAQETVVAHPALDGHNNLEIGAQLFISPGTVEYHLRKVLATLDISARKELPAALRYVSQADLPRSLASYVIERRPAGSPFATSDPRE